MSYGRTYLKQMVAREAIERVMTAHGNDLVVVLGLAAQRVFIAELPRLRDNPNNRVELRTIIRAVA